MVKDKGSWRQAAACRYADPDLFFPISSAGKAAEQIAIARTYCEHCLVARFCLDFALRTRQVHGVWGGTTEEERSRLLRRQALGADTVSGQQRPESGSLA